MLVKLLAGLDMEDKALMTKAVKRVVNPKFGAFLPFAGLDAEAGKSVRGLVAVVTRVYDVSGVGAAGAAAQTNAPCLQLHLVVSR